MVGVLVKSDILPTLKGKNPLVRPPDMGAFLNGTGITIRPFDPTASFYLKV